MGHPSLLSYVLPLIRHAWIIVAAAIVGGIISWLLASNRQISFAQHASFASRIPAGAGGLGAGLLGQLGVSLGAAPGSGYPPEMYAMLLRSADIRRAVINRQYIVREGDATRTVPTLAHAWGIAETDASQRLRLAIGRLDGATSIETDRVTGVVRIEVRAVEAELARQVVKAYLSALHGFNEAQQREAAQRDYAFAQTAVAGAWQSLAQAESELAAFRSRNRALEGSAGLSLSEERLRRQVALREQIYLSLVKAAEDARLASIRSGPVFTVIESPDNPPVLIGRGRLRSAVFGAALAAMLVVVLVYFRAGSRYLTRRSASDPRLSAFIGEIRNLVPGGRRGRSVKGPRREGKSAY